MKTLPGTYVAKKKDNSIYYRASITYNGKHISLGSSDCMQTTHFMYKEAESLLYNISFTMLSYKKNSPLPFTKWVSLLNFRDNGIYFSTPIYMLKKYFLYCFSPTLEYKFDIDDLFYYGHHKIQKRNGHLFVSDFGMQVNILCRYGIKNHAVIGKDYRFINDDITDFRYENIEIINTYYGVQRTELLNKTFYKTKIHINGDYIVGKYTTEDEAAIAYNKAVDLLKQNGFSKKFAVNFLEHLSAREYADIYSKIKLSSKLKNAVSTISSHSLQS